MEHFAKIVKSFRSEREFPFKICKQVRTQNLLKNLNSIPLDTHRVINVFENFVVTKLMITKDHYKSSISDILCILIGLLRALSNTYDETFY